VKKLGEGGKERRYGLAFYPAESIFIDLFMGRYSEFVDSSTKTAKIDSPVFVGLMNQVKKMYDDKIMTGDEGASIFYSSNGISKPEGFMSLYEIFANPKLLQQPEQTGGARVSSSAQFAVQVNSPVKEEAWKVIAFLLSDEVQALPGRTGFSLLKSVNEKQLNEIQKQIKSGTYKLSSGKVPKVSDEQFTQFKQMIDTARSYQSPDMEVYAILNAEVPSFFNGQKSAEEVAKLIQNKVTTFLNE
jgi:multiple sugar transport system substrate-binding protein